jgi:hypothetical protein
MRERRTWSSILRDPGPIRAFVAAASVGMLLGAIDANSSQQSNFLDWSYLLACVLIGAWAAGTAWVCWLPLGVGTFLVHLAAIAWGYKQPYVEENALAARTTLMMLFPAGFLLGVGVGLRVLLSSLGVFRRADGSPVRILHETSRRWLAAIAVVGLAFSLLRWVAYDSSTLYSTGYNEAAFNHIHRGMSAEEVEAMLGPPLMRAGWGKDGTENWIFTQGASATSDYWRRWIVLKDGKVELVISDYWWD